MSQTRQCQSEHNTNIHETGIAPYQVLYLCAWPSLIRQPDRKSRGELLVMGAGEGPVTTSMLCMYHKPGPKLWRRITVNCSRVKENWHVIGQQIKF